MENVAMKLLTSVWSSYYMDQTPEKMVDLFADAGWYATEFSDEHGAVLLERAKERGVSPSVIGEEMRGYAESRGVTFPQGHLLLGVDLCADNAEEILRPWLELFVSLGIRAAVLHPSCRQKELTPEERFARWVEVLRALTGQLHGTEMSIALENAGGILLSADKLTELIDAVGDEHLGICLDTGHLNRDRDIVNCSQGEFIRCAGRRLIALHINDNDGSRDQHLMPFGVGTVDFRDVMRALSDVGYTGLFNLEIPGERRAPLNLRRAKLDYLKPVCETMLSDEFVGE